MGDVTEQLWSLFHLTTRSQIDGLALGQVTALLKTVETSQLANWVAWREGFEQWRPIWECPEFGIAQPDPALQAKNGKRVGKRFAIRYRVYVDTNGTVFSAHTTAISTSGLKIDKPLPRAPKGSFTISLFRLKDQGSLDLICQLVDDRLDSFKIIKVPKRELFQSWLLEDSN